MSLLTDERIAELALGAGRLQAGGVTGTTTGDIADAIRQAVREAGEACWQEVNALIKPGELPGNGCDMHAQRNGLVIATNAIRKRLG